MTDPIIILLIILVVLLTLIVSTFLIALIIVFLALKKTLERLQRAIENVEDTAISSLRPLLSIRTIVQDLGGFVGAITSVSQMFSRKKSSKKQD